MGLSTKHSVGEQPHPVHCPPLARHALRTRQKRLTGHEPLSFLALQVCGAGDGGSRSS